MYLEIFFFEILEERLLSSDVFEKKSLQMSARFAASTAGDLRTALKICQRSIELHRDSLIQSLKESGDQKVTYASVQKSVAEYRETPLLSALTNSCQLDKAIIICICKHIHASGITTATNNEVFLRLTDLDLMIANEIKKNPSFKLKNFRIPSIGVFNERISALQSRGILSTNSAGGLSQSICSLAISIADVTAALGNDVFGTFLKR